MEQLEGRGIIGTILVQEEVAEPMRGSQMSPSQTEHPFRWEVVDLVVTALVAETLGSYRPAQSKRLVPLRMHRLSSAPEVLLVRPSETSCIPGATVAQYHSSITLVARVVVAQLVRVVLARMVETQQEVAVVRYPVVVAEEERVEVLQQRGVIPVPEIVLGHQEARPKMVRQEGRQTTMVLMDRVPVAVGMLLLAVMEAVELSSTVHTGQVEVVGVVGVVDHHIMVVGVVRAVLMVVEVVEGDRMGLLHLTILMVVMVGKE